MREIMLRILGWRMLLLNSDPPVLDRWIWLRGSLKRGPERTFDAGCGNGAFSMYAADIGNQVVAASFSSDEQDAARRRADVLGIAGIDFRILDLRELESHRDSLGTFDQIICLETIEHVIDDAGLMTSLGRMLKPGGQLLLTTPFEGHRPLYTEDPHPSGVEDGSHVRFGYSQAQLERLAHDAGLDVVEQSFVTGVLSQKLTSLMRWLTSRLGLLPAWIIVLPLRALVIVDRPVTRMLRYPYMCVALRGVKRPSS